MIKHLLAPFQTTKMRILHHIIIIKLKFFFILFLKVFISNTLEMIPTQSHNNGFILIPFEESNHQDIFDVACSSEMSLKTGASIIDLKTNQTLISHCNTQRNLYDPPRTPLGDLYYCASCHAEFNCVSTYYNEEISRYVQAKGTRPRRAI